MSEQNGKLIFDDNGVCLPELPERAQTRHRLLSPAQLDSINSELQPTRHDNRRRFLLGVTGGREFALPAEQIVELAAFRGATRVPLAADCIAGVVNIKGRLCAVLSLNSCLGLAPCIPSAQQQLLLVLDQNCEDVCLLVDGVLGLISKDDYETGTAESDMLEHEGRSILLLSLQNILTIGRRQGVAIRGARVTDTGVLSRTD